MSDVPTGYQVSYDIRCMRSLRKLPGAVSSKFLDMMMRFMANPTTKGLNFESVEGAADRNIKSLRVDQKYRAIAYVCDQDILFLHVNDHDKAYRWAMGRRVQIDRASNRIRIVEATPEQAELPPVDAEKAAADETTSNEGLFDSIDDDLLLSVGVTREEIPLVRKIRGQAQLEAAEENFDATTHDALIALAAGYAPDEIRELLAIDTAGGSDEEEGLDFSTVVASAESRQRVFIPDGEEELRRVFEGDLQHWRIFLHPQQRKLAYRDYNGPAMVRGGAGTGKTVVAMHRARHLADQLARTNDTSGKVLVTTFTTSLAEDIKGNLMALCPEHLKGRTPRIEVVNLDRWVRQFLQSKNVNRDIAYFGEDRKRLEELWEETFDAHSIPDGLSREFVRAEWNQIIQAKGVLNEQGYLRVSRRGRGTALDRRKRKALWKIFADYRARMRSEGLMEPDDAYREAIEIIRTEGADLPYRSIVVDEAQDMGEQAFKLIRALIPEDPESDINSIFIVGDAHQRIYNRRASMKACGINIMGRSRKLRLNYRTSDEIRRWAVSILEGVAVDDLDDGIDSLDGYISVFKGPSPQLHAYSNEQEELDELVAWLEALPSGEGGIEYRDVGVLAHSVAQLNQAERRLRERGIKTVRLTAGKTDDRTEDGVRLCTMHRAKGLEFRVVAICFVSANNFPPSVALSAAADNVDREDIMMQFRSLLHVAATRAKSMLRVSWSGKPSEFIQSAAMA